MVECGETYQILGVPAEEVDGLRDVAILAADQQVVLFGVDAGDEGQEGGEEEETHDVYSAVLFCCLELYSFDVGCEAGKREVGRKMSMLVV